MKFRTLSYSYYFKLFIMINFFSQMGMANVIVQQPIVTWSPKTNRASIQSQVEAVRGVEFKDHVLKLISNNFTVLSWIDRCLSDSLDPKLDLSYCNEKIASSMEEPLNRDQLFQILQLIIDRPRFREDPRTRAFSDQLQMALEEKELSRRPQILNEISGHLDSQEFTLIQNGRVIAKEGQLLSLDLNHHFTLLTNCWEPISLFGDWRDLLQRLKSRRVLVSDSCSKDRIESPWIVDRDHYHFDQMGCNQHFANQNQSQESDFGLLKQMSDQKLKSHSPTNRAIVGLAIAVALLLAHQLKDKEIQISTGLK